MDLEIRKLIIFYSKGWLCEVDNDYRGNNIERNNIQFKKI